MRLSSVVYFMDPQFLFELIGLLSPFGKMDFMWLADFTSISIRIRAPINRIFRILLEIYESPGAETIQFEPEIRTKKKATGPP